LYDYTDAQGYDAYVSLAEERVLVLNERIACRSATRKKTGRQRLSESPASWQKLTYKAVAQVDLVSEHATLIQAAQPVRIPMPE
jgi:hypothetical protein